MKDLCVKLSGIGALLICLPVIYRISQGDMFNPASFLLWSMLSVVCVVVLVRAKKGGWVMMAGYALSDFSIGITAYLKSGKASIGGFEWFIVALTAFCAVIYVHCELRKSFKLSVIVNGIACMVAGIPVIVDSILNPYKVSFVIIGLYMAVSALGYYGERNFNGKFIPGLSLIYWITIIGGVLIARS
jgi:hypothetical protein